MLQLSDAIFSGCDSNKITTIVTLDQSVAFDVLRHQTIARKLSLYNFGENALAWITSYLNHRSQYVSIGTRNSTYRNVTSGVPQGSVLGPILYVLYVNELPSIVNDVDCLDNVHVKSDDSNLFDDNCEKCGQIPTYADDSTVVIVTRNRFQAQDRIVTILDRVKSYLAANSLSLNLGKTEIVESMVRQKRVRISGQPPQLSVTKSDGTLKLIQAKDSCRLLGANINKDATWTHQLELGEKPIAKSLRSILGILSYISKFMPIKSRLLLANGLFLSKLLYLLPMWGGLTIKDSKKLQILINKCARTVLGVSRKIQTRALMEGCGWLYFRELVHYHSQVQMYKIINMGTPVNIKNKLIISLDKKIYISPARLKISSRSFRWRTTLGWNDLPDHLRLCGKLSGFKKELKRHIIEGRAEVVPRRPPDRD